MGHPWLLHLHFCCNVRHPRSVGKSMSVQPLGYVLLLDMDSAVFLAAFSLLIHAMQFLMCCAVFLPCTCVHT